MVFDLITLSKLNENQANIQTSKDSKNKKNKKKMIQKKQILNKTI